MPAIRSTAAPIDPGECTADDVDSAALSEGEEEGGGEGEGEDNEIDESVGPLEHDEDHNNIVWTGAGKRTPVLVFSADAVLKKDHALRMVGEKFHLAYKIVKTECKLLRSILHTYGFREVHTNCTDFNLIWTGCHLKPHLLRELADFQKVNHFPRSSELTRKDRLYKNVQRMQQIKGMKHFDFVPSSYVLPGEFQDFCNGFLKDRGPYIVKPIASSRGRGIFLCSHPDQVPLDEPLIVSRYVSNPYLIDGFKFDLRCYVAVTSYDPLIVYLYEEGLARFATVKYQGSSKFLNTQCMHLTNYSVNKKNTDFVQNDDADVEDFGNKWSLGALLRYLKSEGKDTAALMIRIEDVVIKALLAVEGHISTACKMFEPSRGTCFEVYGFDIILDETLRPWLLEVNLSPSLACDSPLDFKIKAHMIADLFTLIGLVCHDPVLRSTPIFKRVPSRHQQRRAGSALGRPPDTPTKGYRQTSNRKLVGGQPALTADEVRMIRRTREEHQRRGGWVRIFPTRDSIDIYGNLFLNPQAAQSNFLLHQNVFPVGIRAGGCTSPGLRAKVPLHSIPNNVGDHVSMDRWLNALFEVARERTTFYERKLGTPVPSNKHLRSRSLPPNQAQRPRQREVVTPVPVMQAKRTTNVEENGWQRAPAPSAPSKPPAAPITILKDTVSRGNNMTKIQARHAFAGYLGRVQRRLLTESQQSTGLDQPSHGDEASERANEQLDLVLRFLRRAAANLQQEFRVQVPSRRLPLCQRKHILAALLADFIRIYTRETEQLRPTMKQSEGGGPGLPDEEFSGLLRNANEAQLEELLTNYTRVNRSAGIFISSKERGGKQILKPPASAHVPKPGGDNPEATEWEPLNGASLPLKKRPATTNNNNIHPSNSLQSRPMSASSSNSPRSAADCRHSNGRPSSSASGRLSFRGSSYDDSAINSGLSWFSHRQKTRQYAASSVVCALPGANLNESRRSASMTNLTSSNESTRSKDIWKQSSASRRLLRQFKQSRALLEESRSKHDALLAQTFNSRSAPSPPPLTSRSARPPRAFPLPEQSGPLNRQPKPPPGPRPGGGLRNSANRKGPVSESGLV